MNKNQRSLGFIGERVGVDSQKDRLLVALRSWDESSQSAKEVTLYNINLHAQQLQKIITKLQPLEQSVFQNNQKELLIRARGYWRTGLILLTCALGPLVWLYYRQQKQITLILNLISLQQEINLSSLASEINVIKTTLVRGIIPCVLLAGTAAACIITSQSRSKRWRRHKKSSKFVQEDLQKLSTIVNSIISNPPSSVIVVKELISSLQAIPSFSAVNS